MSTTPLAGDPHQEPAHVTRAGLGAPRDGTLQPILVPLDGSDLAERALPYAEALAGPDCQLVLLEVGQDEEAFHLRDRHADACAQLEMVTGDPTQQILQVAAQVNAGLIVMTTHGRGALGRWAFGSVADAVARTSAVPVMIIRPTAGTMPPPPLMRRIVAPLDGSPLSERVLPATAALARQLGVPVHLVTAIDVSQLMPVGLTPAVAFNADTYDDAVTRARHDAEGWLTQAVAHLQQRGVEATHEVRAGAPFLVIREITQTGDIIVLASRGRHGAARLVLGSLAEQLIRDGSAPVVLVPSREPGSEQPSVDPISAPAGAR